ncbi:uncharacterized protein LOC101451489 [Ceratitis capitata]|uniref:uncharacterized protein LOC101451489 n=1 Tax=Ceratitis capitata TaxID=7213 RepID=UPI0006188093|nr:uncharacterized protein LOC101451489 [Ceratitis capitata]
MFLYATVTMSDASSESESSDYGVEKSILGKRTGQVPRRQRTRKKSQKNNFQGTHRRRMCIMCLGVFLFLILVCLATVLAINNSNNVYYNSAYNNSKHIDDESSSGINVLVLNWHTNTLPQIFSISSNCTVTFAKTSHNVSMLDYYRNDVIILNSTVQNILDDKDLFLTPTSNQLVIFATNKPLQYHLHTKTSATQANWVFSAFHKSLSYSLKSDFHWSTYRIFRQNDYKLLAPSRQPQWLGARAARFVNNATRDFWYDSVHKSSPLALSILSGPCQVGRNELIDRIAEYIEVHKYGECGDYDCLENDCLLMPQSRGNRTYKFYLAFEEELCEDYVGENFFKALQARLVPVVFGGANYSNFAPPNSYINARDFASMRELAEYLLYLDKNPTEHIKYFAWHDWYGILKVELDFLEVCHFLQKEKEKKTFPPAKWQKSKTVMSWLNANKCEAYKLPEAWLS